MKPLGQDIGTVRATIGLLVVIAGIASGLLTEGILGAVVGFYFGARTAANAG